jgi:hypothetical protein
VPRDCWTHSHAAVGAERPTLSWRISTIGGDSWREEARWSVVMISLAAVSAEYSGPARTERFAVDLVVDPLVTRLRTWQAGSRTATVLLYVQP